MVAHDAVILAGGAARRLGGALKPQVTVRGRRLLDHVLDATGQARRVVVVAPDAVPVPDGVTRTLEDPPFGGPVAGVAAGLDALPEPAAPWVLLLACDLPGAAAAVPRLLAAVDEFQTERDGTVGRAEDGGGPAGAGGPGGAVAGGPGGAVAGGPGGAVEGVVLRDGDGREQWLLGIYAAAALHRRVDELVAAGGLRGTSVRELVRPLWRSSLEAHLGEAADVDTWADRDAMSP